MSYLRALIGGFLGGALGTAAWIAVCQFTGYEVGYVAVFVGFLSGWFVQKACSGYDVNIAHGMIASICAVSAIAGAKYSLVSTAITHAKETIESIEPERDELIACVADSLVNQIQEKGQSVVDADHEVDEVDGENGDATDDAAYPPAIMSVATELWDQLLDEERHAYECKARDVQAAALGFGPSFLTCSVDELTSEEFKNSFGIHDILWFSLAVGAAFKFGSSATDDDDEDYEEEADDEEAE